jgi:hypothetical protein
MLQLPVERLALSIAVQTVTATAGSAVTRAATLTVLAIQDLAFHSRTVAGGDQFALARDRCVLYAAGSTVLAGVLSARIACRRHHARSFLGAAAALAGIGVSSEPRLADASCDLVAAALVWSTLCALVAHVAVRTAVVCAGSSTLHY